MTVDRSTVKQLAGAAGPAVSIVCPLEARVPGNRRDEQVLKELRGTAERQLRGWVLDQDVADAVVQRLDDAIGSVDMMHPTRGIAVLASREVSRVVPLEITVEPRVVVGEHFAIGELLEEEREEGRVRVLVISLGGTRCIDLDGPVPTERTDAGFPVSVEAPTRADTPHGDFPLDAQEHAEAARFVLRAVDDALAKVDAADPRPIVLLGAERDLAYWDEVSTSDAPVIGRVHGNFEWAGAAEVATHAAPAVDADRLAREQAAVREVHEKLSNGAVCGIAEVWADARTGRGHRLVVEEGYHFKARLAGERLGAAPPAAADAFDAVNDAMREQTLHDGEVVVVRPGALADLGRIGLVLRY